MDGNELRRMESPRVWFALALLTLAATPDANSVAVPPSREVACCSVPNCQCAVKYKSANFEVRSEASRLKAYEVAERCESLRANLQHQWLATQPHLKWVPTCEIVLHATRANYLSAVGVAAASTTGCTSLRVDQDRVTFRRVDVCAENVERALSALSHELTHVVLTDRFKKTPLPRWADEGIATLADRMEKQEGHHRDLLQSRLRGGTFRIGELLATEDYPAPQRMAAFYGQSTSLVRFLIHRKTPTEFIRFVEKARVSGYDAALRDVYEIQGVAELDNLWSQYASTEAATPNSRANIALLNMDVLVTLAQQ